MLSSVYDGSMEEYEFNKRHLFKLLSQRKEHQNISHRHLPTYRNHERFVELKPYKNWFIIFDGPMRVGSIYITEKDEIGLAILDDCQNKGYGSLALGQIFKDNPKTVFYANINPRNYKSINFFKKHGFVWKSNYTKNGLDVAQATYVRL